METVKIELMFAPSYFICNKRETFRIRIEYECTIEMAGKAGSNTSIDITEMPLRPRSKSSAHEACVGDLSSVMKLDIVQLINLSKLRSQDSETIHCDSEASICGCVQVDNTQGI